jgi:ATP-dependent helicase/DNAse subunit B
MVPLREPATLAALAERPWSASSLELWIRCPARWFIERMLDPRDLDPTAEPLSRGALAHAVLSDVLEGLRLETGSARLSPGRLARALELLGGALAVREQEFPLSVAAERVPSSRRRLLADLERFLRTEAERESPLEPVHLERGFGFAAEETDEAEPLPALELGEGMRLRGRIDRIDVDGRGRAIVYDYKSAKVPIPDRWATDGNLQVPLYMRAAGELLGLEVVGGFYQPLSGEDLRPRGVLDADAGIELECVRGDLREGDAVSGQVEEAMAAARAAAREAASGALESRPSSCGWNGSGCAYPTICRCEQ